MSIANDLVQAAVAAARNGQLPIAIEKARAAISVEPGNEQARMILAHALDRVGKPAEASEIVDEMLRMGSARPELLHLQANLLRKAGRIDEAVPFAERFSKVRPESADGHSHLAVLLVAAGHPEDAIVSLKRAVRLNPNLIAYQYNLAQTLIQLGRESEALQALSRLLTTSPEFALGYVCLGELLLKQGLDKDAIDAARKALSAQPDCAEAHILLARALSVEAVSDAIGALDEEAERHVRTALDLDPGSSSAHGILGFALQEKGDFGDAFAEFEQSIRLNPRQGAVYYGLAMCRKFTGEDDVHRDRMAQALHVGGLEPMDEAYLHYALGKVLEDQGQFEPALKQFDAANRLMFKLRSPLRPFDGVELERRVSSTIELFDRAYFEAHTGIGSSSELPLIVVGMMRSGTTLVEQILSSHPCVMGAGELMFWHENAGKVVWEDTKSIDPSQARAVSENYLSLLREIGPTAVRVTDKMPQNTMFLGLIHAMFPEARIIHCRRNPVDNCLSIYATPYGTSPDFAHDRGNIVFAYRQYLRLMQHWREVIPADRLLEVAYEGLVDNREAVTRRMVAFAGLDWDEACLSHEANPRMVKTPSRWQVRQPIYRTSVARWKNYESWLAEFAEFLQPM